MMPSALTKKMSRGFTMIELLVVIGIICLLVAILGSVLGKLRERTKLGAAKTLVEKCYSGLELYHLSFRAFPPATTPSGLTGSQALYYYLSTTWRTAPNAANGEQWADLNVGPFSQFQSSEIRKSGTGFDIMDPYATPLQFKINVLCDTQNQTTNMPLIYSCGTNKADEHTVFRPGAVAGSGTYATTPADPNPNLNSDDILNGN